MKHVFGFMTILLLSGCIGGRTPEASFYTFAPRGDVVPVSEMNRTIDVARVRVAEYIDRPQMVTVDGTHVNIAQDHRWVAGLGQITGGRVISNLAQVFPNAVVKDSNFGSVGDCNVLIELRELNGNLGSGVRMDALYTIACGEYTKTRRIDYVMPVGDSYSDYARIVGDMVDQMSDQIARDLVAAQ